MEGSKSFFLSQCFYVQPHVLQTVGGILNSSQQSQSVTFVQLFGSKPNAQKEYAHGLIGLGSFLLAIFVLWWLILILLSFCGRRVGCASGRPFDTVVRTDFDSLNTNSSADEDDVKDAKADLTEDGETQTPSSQLATLNDFYKYDGGEESVTENMSQYPVITFVNPAPSTPTSGETNTPLSEKDHNRRWEWSARPQQQGAPTKEELAAMAAVAARNKLRQRRTRIIYLFFASLAILSSILILSQVYSPIQQAATNTNEVALEAHGILNDIEDVLANITGAANGAFSVIKTLPLNFTILCPAVHPSQLQAVLGVDPQVVVEFINTEFDPLQQFIDSNISSIEQVLRSSDKSLEGVDSTIRKVDDKLWLIPFTLIILMALTIAFMFGIALAWGNRSHRYQTYLACVNQPIFIILTVMCWCFLIATCLGTVVTSGKCLSC